MSLLTSHPHTEVLYIGDFNVHYTDRLQSTHTDVGGIEAFHFSFSNKLEQIIKHPICVHGHHDHAANTLDLFLISNPQNYTYTVFSPLGSSVSSSFTPPPPILRLSIIYGTLKMHVCQDEQLFLRFPCNDYCFWTRDPDLAATAAGEVMDSGIRAYILYSLITFSPFKPWFDRACSAANLELPSELIHATFISARNHCSAKIFP